MRRFIPLLFVLLMLGMAACDPFAADQIKAQAIADQTAMRSQQEALNQELARRQSADLHSITMWDATRKQNRKDALEPVVRTGWGILIFSVFMVGTLAIVYSVVVVGRQTVVQLNRVQEGFATAMIQAADLRSRLIYLDPATRQYPLIYQYNGKGRYLITDPNRKITMELDTRNEGDAQMIAGSIAVQHSGILVMEQRRSGARDAASMAKVTPPIIEGAALDVKTIARDLAKGGWDDE